MRSVPDLSRESDGNRVQEKEKCHLYPVWAGNRTKTGYRRRKSAICTRFEREIGRKPGTGEGKVPSVPDRNIITFMTAWGGQSGEEHTEETGTDIGESARNRRDFEREKI